MSDSELRNLERRKAAGEDVQNELERAWLRAGLGWHGEQLPEPRQWFFPSRDERGVYYCAPVNSGDKHAVFIPFVYVPAGAVKCVECMGVGTLGRAMAGSMAGAPCLTCKGSGTEDRGPFYIGRYPVTWGEISAWSAHTGNHLPQYPTTTHTPWRGALFLRDDPAVNVHLAQAETFCKWLHGRLPTREEWYWAARGYSGELDCPDYLTGRFAPTTCPQCVGRMCYGPKRYPWGNEEPTPERCVPRGMNSTQPVVIPRVTQIPVQVGRHAGVARYELVPARPLGASWCGAMDMVGHVRHWVQHGEILGGSFRCSNVWTSSPGLNGTSDDLGFRVVIDAME